MLPEHSCGGGNIAIDAALAVLDQHLQPLEAVTTPLSAALHRVTAATLTAQCDLPPFDQSAVDGYAVRTADLATIPCRLPLAATIAAGPLAAAPLLPERQACRIFTGGMLPQGTDTIVRQELTERDGDNVVICAAVGAGIDLRRRGEELRYGTPVVAAGKRLHAGLVGALAAAGIAEVKVRRSPRIRVLITGDELVSAGSDAGRGEIFDSNGPLVAAWFAAAGYHDVHLRRVPDEQAAVTSALAEAFDNADLVVSTGGVSVGDRDLLPGTAEALGAQRLFWKVSQKPGKPLYSAQRGRCLFLGLPGNPGAVLINLAVFVRRALDRLEGLDAPGPQRAVGRLGDRARCDAHRDTWLRVRRSVDAEGRVLLLPLGRQASHMISNLAQADTLALLPARANDWAPGEAVEWLPLSGF
ncbi:molybdopterin molybdotransferase MoeA [Sinimarinibacterium sp. CAU 1509]|uniref:molybdopterin molybdotransferase MoeA n=1 Tax=Sinimarinibacterium sp. CAU 1509 TaxID=2562283 RepID=UPI0010AC93B3|nr:gephyrin-like molybdotransferase Glp [Sinimarinibacterium sp. CAU 1509]TJY58182.1 molybdopterin molybdotransferase MoeA [Sinimarinibacterium sp. CAU 1509]